MPQVKHPTLNDNVSAAAPPIGRHPPQRLRGGLIGCVNGSDSTESHYLIHVNNREATKSGQFVEVGAMSRYGLFQISQAILHPLQ